MISKLTNHSMMKLGKLPAVHDQRIPLLHKYIAHLPPAPVEADWTKGLTSFGMMANDKLGDCTAAGVGHAYQIWSANARQEWTPKDEQIIGFYSGSTNYNPRDPSTDQGGVETSVLRYLLKEGFCGRHISGFASITAGDTENIKQAVHLLGGCYTGIGLPISAQSQDVWDLPAGGAQGDGAPGSWGGHCVFVPAYNARGPICVTWGALKQMTWAFWHAYGDEAYGVVAGAWIKDGASPGGIKIAELMTDMAALRAA